MKQRERIRAEGSEATSVRGDGDSAPEPATLPRMVVAEDEALHTGRLPDAPPPPTLPPLAVTPTPPAANDPTPAPSPAPARRRGRRGSPSPLAGLLVGLLMGTLLTALVALLILIQQGRTLSALEQRVAASDQRVQTLAAELETVGSRAATLEGRADSMEALPPRLDELSATNQRLAAQGDALSGEVATLGGQVERLDGSLGTLGDSVGALEARTGVFDEFLVGLRELALSASPAAAGASAARPTLALEPATLRQGATLLLRATNLEPGASYDLLLVNASGDATLLTSGEATRDGGLRLTLPAAETRNLAAGRYTIALHQAGASAPLTEAALTVQAAP